MLSVKYTAHAKNDVSSASSGMIVGDYENISSKSLLDFIYECNAKGNILFVSTHEKAIKRFSN
ncbi:MAG: hypothetical protein SCALA702_03100 [Melioribacteraceae bacterium]|nr:MAG: hypothetical protein SCALA702_03100 [Melioribacteraceae bacterium]